MCLRKTITLIAVVFQKGNKLTCESVLETADQAEKMPPSAAGSVLLLLLEFVRCKAEDMLENILPDDDGLVCLLVLLHIQQAPQEHLQAVLMYSAHSTHNLGILHNTSIKGARHPITYRRTCLAHLGNHVGLA